MKTLEDLQTELLKISLTEDEVYMEEDYEDTWLTIMAFDGRIDITEKKTGNWLLCYNGGSLVNDIKNVNSIYDWIIATMKMNGMRIR